MTNRGFWSKGNLVTVSVATEYGAIFLQTDEATCVLVISLLLLTFQAIFCSSDLVSKREYLTQLEKRYPLSYLKTT